MSFTHYHANYPDAPAHLYQRDADKEARQHKVPKINSYFGASRICYDPTCLTPAQLEQAAQR